jgi:hypothetical protein
VAGRLTRKKLDDIWRSGFCRKMVEHAMTTEDTLQGSQARIEWLREHIPECDDCYYANLLKNEEAAVAEEMGPQALGAFMRGEDITQRPGYSPSLVKQAMDRIADQGRMTPEFVEWMHRAAKRKRFKRYR